MDSTPDNKKTAAVCGLFCPACTFFIATTQDPARLQTLAKRFGLPAAELECHGCRSEKRCVLLRPALQDDRDAPPREGFDFCGQCPDYPCPELVDFQAQMPHRLELWESQERINGRGGRHGTRR